MKKYIIFLLLITSLIGNAQKKEPIMPRIEIGTELQIYPVGYMPMLTSNVFLNEKWALRLRIGGNFADRQGFSDFNDDETAEGFGGSIGVVRYFPYGKGNLIAGVSIDVWNMWTDWKDGLNTSNPTLGRTYTLVLQPWINGGYLFDISNKWSAGASVGFGKESNVITKGEKVGEDWMGILTFSVNYKLK